MRKGICFGFLKGNSVGEKFALAAELGFQCVEVSTLTSVDQRAEFHQAATAAGIAVPSVMNSGHWGSPLSDPDPLVREKSVQDMVNSIETAEALGADTVLLVPAVVNADVTYEQAWERSVDTIRTILPIAEDKGVTIAVENVWNKFLLSPLEFAQYVDSFENARLAAYFDVGNIVAYGFPQHWIRTLGKRIRKVHIKGFDAKEHAFVQLLAGSIDWPEVMKALREVGYDDVMTAELRGPTDDAEGLRQISADMDRILADN